VTTRCPWAQGELLSAYHDQEWGRPVTSDAAVFERLSLEVFQSGLSWLTILRKRDAFRDAFTGFDPALVAGFDETDQERLLADAGIVRNRAKISAVIGNARAVMALTQAEGPGALKQRFYAAAPDHHERPTDPANVPGSTPESTAFVAQLRKLGFRFIGPTTAYAAMQACGVVNDHVSDCEFGSDLG